MMVDLVDLPWDVSREVLGLSLGIRIQMPEQTFLVEAALFFCHFRLVSMGHSVFEEVQDV